MQSQIRTPNWSVLSISLALALSAILAVVRLLPGDPPRMAIAQAAELRVCLSGCIYSTIQAAVDAAGDGDIIKVAAGVYTDVQGRPRNDISATGVVTQVVYISKTVTIQGGYTTTNWTTPDPVANPTTLDAQGQGRVLYITGSISPTMEGLRLTRGDAFGLGGDPMKLVDGGGGVYIITATATLSNSHVYSNAGYAGSGIAVISSSATLIGNLIMGNVARDVAQEGYGGGVYLSSSLATLLGNTIRDNRAEYGGGGGAYLHYSAARLEGNTFAGNTTDVCNGGGLHLNYSPAVISGNTFISNVSPYGGGLYVSNSAAVLMGNVVLSNTASDWGGGLVLLFSPVTMTNNSIVSNTAANYGGGVYLENSSATLNGNTVSGNQVTGSGGFGQGGGLALSSSNSTLSGNIIKNNAAHGSSGGYGGGLYLGGGSDALINNVIADNQADSSGSGVYVSTGSPSLLHTTLARNTGGDGSGLYSMAMEVVMTNTIVVSQSIGVRVESGYGATLNGVLWYSNTANTGGGGIFGITNEYTGAPAFAADGYHLTAGSAAIDRAVNTDVTSDIDGDARPHGMASDLGADEFGPMTLVVTSTADSGPGTLRQAMLSMWHGDRITFDTTVFPPTQPVTIALASALPDLITNNVTIDGSNAGVILDGSGIGATPETVLLDDVSLTLDGGSNLIINGNFAGGLGHWRPWDQGPGATRSLIVTDVHSLLNAYRWSVVARTGDSRTVYDKTDISDPFAGWSDTLWISATGGSAVEVRFWYRLGGVSAALDYLFPDGHTEEGISGQWFDRRPTWAEAVITGVAPSGAIAVALEFDLTHSERWVSGLVITSTGNTIQGLQIVNFPSDGIKLWDGAHNNLIGGDRGIGVGPWGQGNLISGNGDRGVFIEGSGTMSNTVSGNAIGTDVSGTLARGNRYEGVWIGDGAHDNFVGGNTPGQRNLISGNGGDGVGIVGTGTTNNTVSGNTMGTNIHGTAALPNNGAGVTVGWGAQRNRIGGGTPDERNVISGNGKEGVWIGGGGTMSNTISGNFIGTNVSGTAAIGNAWNGVWIGLGAQYNLIGGSTPGQRNLISGNGSGMGGGGIWFNDSGTMSNTVIGNYIGTDANGTGALGNDWDGVFIGSGASNNIIGGTTAAERNLISGNARVGVSINGQGNGTAGNVVRGNTIGADVTGIGSLGNGVKDAYTGVEVYYSPGNTIENNLISGNNGSGVAIQGNSSTGNVVRGNLIGTDISGTVAISNTRSGVQISNGAQSNLIGGNTPGERNVVSGNGSGGVLIGGSGTSYNQVAGNFIGTDATGTQRIPNGPTGAGKGVWIYNGAADNVVGGTSSGERNVISGNDYAGIEIYGAGTTGNVVQGNYIGVDTLGTVALGNREKGVFIFSGAQYNRIGGMTAGERNIISGNDGNGVQIEGAGSDYN